ncbi:MAG: Mth938-like domain-containing protein [Mesorhizobium sp.]|nr:Mth938-like domain-containing protein [Mesorhizobium sp.]
MAGRGIILREAHYPGRAPIEAYGNGGFRFADMSHRGSLVCLPSGIHGWQPADPAALTAEDFALVLAEAAGIEILLVGTGTDLRPLPAALRAAFKEARIAAEPMSTGAAVRTYNVLLAEDRAVAAAFVAVD